MKSHSSARRIAVCLRRVEQVRLRVLLWFPLALDLYLRARIGRASGRAGQQAGEGASQQVIVVQGFALQVRGFVHSTAASMPRGAICVRPEPVEGEPVEGEPVACEGVRCCATHAANCASARNWLISPGAPSMAAAVECL